LESRSYYYGLDAVRLGSAFIVSIFHLGFYTWANSSSTTAHVFGPIARFESLTALTWFGWVGVEVFFVISGFVIVNSASAASPWEFLKGRILRLYPAVWICATFTLAALIFVANDTFRDVGKLYAKSLLLYPLGPWIDGVYWTLAIELSFYALVFVILLSRGVALVAGLAWGLTLFGSVFIAYLSLRQFGNVRIPILDAAVDSHPTLTDVLLLRHGSLFAVGIWLWLIANHRMKPDRWVGLVLALVGSSAEIYGQAVGTVTQTAAAGQPAWIPLAIWIVATFLIFLFTHFERHFIPATPLAARTLRQMGLMTYPYYLLQNVVGASILRLELETGLNPVAAFPLAFIGLLGLSWVVSQLFEPRLRQLVRRLLEPQRVTQLQVPR
jgi:exopolysaccharide production protein ExoZ